MTTSATPPTKRFYKTVTLGRASPFAILLDGRAVKTPAKMELALPSRSLGQAVADEWSQQGETLDIQAMHLTRLANVAIDRTGEARDELALEVVNYARTDLLCHLAEGPADLRDLQAERWGPVRQWAGQALGVVLVPVEGIMAVPQPTTSLDAAYAHAAGLDDFRLTGLAFGCALFGSAVLALALERGRLSAGEAFELSRLDEDYQIAQWGEDEEAHLAHEGRRLEAEKLGVWFDALS